MKRLTLFDSTLRDGAQGQGISFSVSDKLNILRLLDGLGFPTSRRGTPFPTPRTGSFSRRPRKSP